jgi:hypothetical protein
MHEDEIPVGKAKDLRGKVFGRLTVLYRVKNKGNAVAWKCQCSCGKIVEVRGNNLTRKNYRTTSCGCKNGLYLPGMQFGDLTVIEEIENSSPRLYKCKCSCGDEVVFERTQLTSNVVHYCGNKNNHIERTNFNNLAGQRFGKLTVIKFSHWLDHNNGHRDRMWLCKCDCGNECIVNHRYLRFGDTESCGCTKSRGNASIARWLNANHKNYQAEYFFKDFYTTLGNYYKFDFAIFKDSGELDFLIEFQGNIHFKIGTGWNTEEALKDCQKRDKIKYNYCQEHNIKLYYITYEEIIEDRLEEIFSEQQ